MVIDRQWVVAIYADHLRQCMSAMLLLWRVLVQTFDSDVSLEMIETGERYGRPLAKAVEQLVKQERWRRRLAYALPVATILGLILTVVTILMQLLGGSP